MAAGNFFVDFPSFRSYLDHPSYIGPEAQIFPVQSSDDVFNSDQDGDHGGLQQPGTFHYFDGQTLQFGREHPGRAQEFNRGPPIDRSLYDPGDFQGVLGAPRLTGWNIEVSCMSSKPIC
jgi:hypothetical protein